MLAMALQQYGQQHANAPARQVTPDQFLNQTPPQQNNFGQTQGQAFMGAMPPVFPQGSMMPQMMGGK